VAQEGVAERVGAAITEILVPAFRRMARSGGSLSPAPPPTIGSQLATVLDRENFASGVCADNAYRSAANLNLPCRRGQKPEVRDTG
jgi:hypothetical protein